MAELLAPAGSPESLRAAVNAGADAVYIGGRSFGARAYADNPDQAELVEGIEFCHLRGRKLYLTVNTLLKERELTQQLYDYLLPYYENGLDGVIVQDFGVVCFIQEHFPGLAIHASTQMTVTSPEGARFLQARGITRIVLARELSLQEISAIICETGIEVETFVHGAMCYSYSGQCLLSSMIGGRSGNRGRCAQPCRLPYSVMGQTDRKGSFLLSMCDMCTVDLLPDLLDAGIASFKIEGRMKRPEYTAGVVHIYRKYMDLYQEKGRDGFSVTEEDRRILLDLYNRGGFSEGYYRQENGPSMMAFGRPNHRGTKAACMAGKSDAVALEPLHRQDVLELAPGREITLPEDVPQGRSFRVAPKDKTLRAGTVLWRTRNAFLLQELGERYLLQNCKEKIKGDLRITEDGTAILELSCRGIRVSVSDVCAQIASGNPTSAETIRRQLLKTGNTPFEFAELEISAGEDLFIPVSALNALRREGLGRLQETILDQWRRPGGQAQMQSESVSAEQIRIPIRLRGTGICHMPLLNVLVTTKEQLQSVFESASEQMDILYLDSLLAAELCGFSKRGWDRHNEFPEVLCRAHERGWRCFMSFPPVLRARDRAFLEQPRMMDALNLADGFLLHTVCELACAKKLRGAAKDTVFAADDSLYAYNTEAARFLAGNGIQQFTLPAELNCHELLSLSDALAALSGGPSRVKADYGRTAGATERTADGIVRELVVYGRQPLMHSAQCVRKNTAGCTGEPGFLWLKDRRNAQFLVLNRCPICCNTIYNSVPLELAPCADEIAAISPEALRLSFTVESSGQVRKVFGRYAELCRSVYAQRSEQASGQPQRCGTVQRPGVRQEYARPSGRETAPDERMQGTRGHFKRGVE